MKLETLIYEKQDRIATVTLNRPHTGNAISVQLRDELDLVMDDLDDDDETRVLIIKANGNHFGTGYDLKEFSYLWDADSAINDIQRRPHRRNPVWSRREFHLPRERWMRLFRLRQCTIAVIHGHCVAGSLDLIGVCDIAFAADDALLGQPEARAMGQFHAFAMWPIHLGMRKTKEWLFTGDNMTETEAAEMGLVNRAVPRDGPEAVAWPMPNASPMSRWTRFTATRKSRTAGSKPLACKRLWLLPTASMRSALPGPAWMSLPKFGAKVACARQCACAMHPLRRTGPSGKPIRHRVPMANRLVTKA